MKLAKWVTHGLRRITFSTRRAEIIPFPPIMTPTIPAFKRYLIDTLKMKGIPFKVDMVMDNHPIDIVLTSEKMMILCVENQENPMEKTHTQELRHFAKSIGYRLVVINKDNFYKGMNATFFKLKQQRIFTHR